MKDLFKFFLGAMIAIVLFGVCVAEVGGVIVGLARLSAIAVPMVLGWYC